MGRSSGSSSRSDNKESKKSKGPHGPANLWAFSFFGEVKPFVKNTLQTFFTATTPSGLVIRGCSLHVKNGARWIGMPAQKFV
jgi:hypothetical protein